MTTPTPLTLPAHLIPAGVNPYLDAEIRKMATEILRETWDANHRAMTGLDSVSWDYCMTDHEGREAIENLTDVQDRFLRDLSRPASRDAMARWLAAHHGLTVGATAPDFGRYVCGEHCCDGQRGRMVPCARPIWSLMGAEGTMVTFADCPDPDAWGGDERCHVPGISALTNPAEALRAACLAAVGRTA